MAERPNVSDVGSIPQDIDVSKPPPDPEKRHWGAILFSAAVLLCFFGKGVAKGPQDDGFVYLLYAIVVVCGAIAGSWETHLRWAGAIGGVVAGVCMVGALEVLTEVRVIHRAIFLAVLAAGLLPGFIVYSLLKEIDRIVKREPRPIQDEPTWMGDARGRRRRMIIITVVFTVLIAGMVLLSIF
jgi:hypothetical protein